MKIVMERRETRGWVLGAVLVAGAALVAAWASPRFGYDVEVPQMPVLWLAGGLVACGVLYSVGLPRLLAATTADAKDQRGLLLLVIAAGLVARLVLMPSEPMLEDDYQRYLWDGAVVAHGHNPYAIAPATARAMGARTPIGKLAADSGVIVPRINHPELRTIYPPVAQAAFALAHVMKPWSIVAWRVLLLACDLATLTLIIILLRAVGRSPLWAALYWWHPVVIKEFFNSAHMDAMLLPMVLGAVWLVWRNRPVEGSALLALAAGAKLWPAMLLPILLRPLLAEKGKLAAALSVFAIVLAACLWPILMGGLGDNSGFVAYAERWKTNSAHMQALEPAVAWLLAAIGLDGVSPALAARGLLAMVLATVVLALAWRSWSGCEELLRKCALAVAALVLLAPAQYPWYTAWLAPFLPFLPLQGFLLLSVTVPLYYTFFHLAGIERAELFRQYVVWMIWVPVWAVLAVEARRFRTGQAAPLHGAS
jgi:hypothetical protein